MFVAEALASAPVVLVARDGCIILPVFKRGLLVVVDAILCEFVKKL